MIMTVAFFPILTLICAVALVIIFLATRRNTNSTDTHSINLREKIIKIIIIVINVILCFILPFSLLLLVVSPMMFDAPGSIEDFNTNITFYSIILCPITILVSVIGSFLLRKKSYIVAFVLSLLPIINVAFVCYQLF